MSGDGIFQEPDFGYTIFKRGQSENVRREVGVGFAINSKIAFHLQYGVLIDL